MSTNSNKAQPKSTKGQGVKGNYFRFSGIKNKTLKLKPNELAEAKILKIQKKPELANYGFNTNGGDSGEVSATHEIVYEVTDYFDDQYSSDEGTTVTNYWVGMQQSAFGSAPTGGDYTGSDRTALRIQKVWLYALPLTQFGGSGAAPIADSIYRTQFRLPARIEADGGTLQGLCNQTTEVRPNYFQEWVRVGYYELEQSLKSGLYRPVVVNDTITSSNGKCLLAFQVQALEPDGFSALDIGKPVQYKVVMEIAQPLPLINTFKIGLVGQENFTLVDGANVSDEPVLIDVKKMNSNKY